jgi:hypothetical protein
VSAVTAFTDDAISSIDVVTCWAAVDMSCAVCVTLWIEALVSFNEVATSRIAAASVQVPVVTCSTEAATSLIDDTTFSVEDAIDSAWTAVSFSDAAS